MRKAIEARCGECGAAIEAVIHIRTRREDPADEIKETIERAARGTGA